MKLQTRKTAPTSEQGWSAQAGPGEKAQSPGCCRSQQGQDQEIRSRSEPAPHPGASRICRAAARSTRPAQEPLPAQVAQVLDRCRVFRDQRQRHRLRTGQRSECFPTAGSSGEDEGSQETERIAGTGLTVQTEPADPEPPLAPNGTPRPDGGGRRAAGTLAHAPPCVAGPGSTPGALLGNGTHQRPCFLAPGLSREREANASRSRMRLSGEEWEREGLGGAKVPRSGINCHRSGTGSRVPVGRRVRCARLPWLL